MAAVSKRKRKVGVDAEGEPIYRDDGWQVRYVDPDGNERRRSFTAKKGPGGADAFAAEVETQKARGAYVDSAAGKVTFKAYAEEWRAAQVHRDSTVNAVETRLRLHVYPLIGNRPLGAIRHTEIVALVKDRSKVLATSTVAKVLKDLKQVLNAAVLDRKIAVSPAAAVPAPTSDEPDEDVVPFADAEVDAIHDALVGPWKLAADLGLGAGLRIGEVLGLNVERVDFLRREIKVVEQMQTLTGHGTRLVPLKTKTSYRTIPIAAELATIIAGHVAAHCPDGGLLFTLPDGRNVSSGMWSHEWVAAIKTAGLEPGTRFHRLRHTYASALIHGGCSVKEVQARLGHATAKETLDTYGHLWPNAEDRTREATAGLFSRRSAPHRTSGMGITP